MPPFASRFFVFLAAAALGGLASDAPAPMQPAGPVDAIAIIVHRSNTVDALTLADLRRIFMLDTQTWPNGRKITLVLRDKSERERQEAIQMICGLTLAQYERHVLFQTFRGTTTGGGPRAILSASAMLRFVFNAPGAIGYLPADQADGSIKVLRIDNLLPSDPGYPLRRKPSR